MFNNRSLREPRTEDLFVELVSGADPQVKRPALFRALWIGCEPEEITMARYIYAGSLGARLAGQAGAHADCDLGFGPSDFGLGLCTSQVYSRVAKTRLS